MNLINLGEAFEEYGVDEVFSELDKGFKRAKRERIVKRLLVTALIIGVSVAYFYFTK